MRMNLATVWRAHILFYAFISYRHADMSWGKWVQRALEAYRLPAELCTELNFPEHVTPVFRDKTDLTGGDTVFALLDERLKESKFLIVICSRELAKKQKYIDYEIEKFLELGNPLNRVIPLVVDGVPKSGDPLTECFPPALLRHGDAVPLAVNVVADGKRTALLKLVAILLGIDLSALRSHDKVRRQRLYIKVFIAGCIFMLGMSLFFAWQYFSVKQAELHEQMVYAEDLYTDGDRIRAKIICDEVLNSFTPIMDQRVQICLRSS